MDSAKDIEMERIGEVGTGSGRVGSNAMKKSGEKKMSRFEEVDYCTGTCRWIRLKHLFSESINPADLEEKDFG